MKRQRKRRLVKKWLRAIAILLALLIITALISVGVSKLICDSGAAAEDVTYIEYYVQTGDTLWSIAKKHSNNNVDLRELIYEIEEKNQLDSAWIYVGDMLLVPTTYCGETK